MIYIPGKEKETDMKLLNDSPAQTTTEAVELEDVQDISNAISEAIFYDGYSPVKVMAKANEVVGALIHILVARGLLTSADVKRILASPRKLGPAE